MRKFAVFMIALIFGMIASVAPSGAYSGESWTVEITAIGQQRENYANQASVTFGRSDPATDSRILSPPSPPSTTILLSLYDMSTDSEYAYDLRPIASRPIASQPAVSQPIGAQTETWLLRVQNKPKPGSGYKPLLRWEIPSSLNGTMNGTMSGTLELRRGDSATGDFLVADMSAVTSYQMETSDADQLLTIVWKQKTESDPTPVLKTYYYDNDGDGYGDTGNSRQISAPEGKYTALESGDCDDSDAAIHPRALEICDGKDNDCDGMTDEDIPQTTYYLDADNDGYGNPSVASLQACSAPSGYVPSGYVSNNRDCNDSDAAIHPGATEACDDGKDNDCDGRVDPPDLCASQSDPCASQSDLCPPQSAVSVKVMNAQGHPGQTEVVVPVEISQAAGVAGLDFTLSYDPAILTAQEVKSGSLISNFFSQVNIEQGVGKVYFSMAHSSYFTTEQGTFATIIFKVAASATGETSVPLILESLRVYNENGKPYLAKPINGEFQIVSEGIIGDLNQDQDITSADAILALKIAVSKLIPTEYQKWAGDVNRGGWINSGDAILILKAAVKMKTIFFMDPDRGFPNTTIRIVGWNFGDTQGDSAVSFDNIVAEPLLWSNHEVIATLPSIFQSGGQVKVTLALAGRTPSNFCIFTTDSGQTAVTTRLRNLPSYTMPDSSIVPDSSTVSDSSTMPDSSIVPDLSIIPDSSIPDSSAMPEENPKTISISAKMTASRYEQVSIPVEIDDAAGLAGIDLVLDYDPALLEPVNAECTSLTDGFLLIFDAPTDGRLKVSLVNHIPISSGRGALVNLTFKVTSTAQENDSTALVIENVGLYDENAEPMQVVVRQSGLLTILDEENRDDSLSSPLSDSLSASLPASLVTSSPYSPSSAPAFSFTYYSSLTCPSYSFDAYLWIYSWLFTTGGQFQYPLQYPRSCYYKNYDSHLQDLKLNPGYYWLYWLQNICPYYYDL